MKGKVGKILFCLGLFLFFVLWRFPYQNLKGHIFSLIYKKTRIVMSADEIGPAFLGWPGISLSKADLTIPIKRDRLNIQAESVVAKVGIGGLFPFGPLVSLYFRNLKEGGDLYVKYKQAGSRRAVILEAEGVILDQLALQNMPDAVRGKLDAEADMSIDIKKVANSHGYLNLDATGLTLPPANVPQFLLSIPSLSLGKLTGRLVLNKGVAEITEFTFGGPKADLKGSLTGSIQLKNSMPQSKVDLRLTVEVSERIKNDPSTVTFLSILNTYKTSKPGVYAMEWSGTFKSLQSNPLPNRVQ